MLTTIEKILFVLAVLASAYGGYLGALKIIKIVSQGHGKPEWGLVGKRLIKTVFKVGSLQPTWSLRFGTSILHAFVAWGFLYYILVNIGDFLQAFIKDYTFLGNGVLGNIYRLGSDILSVAVLIGMIYLMIRRFLFKPEILHIRDDILLYPKAKKGISRDSAIVGGFILLHVGFRFIGESFHIAAEGIDPWQPFASSLSSLWTSLHPVSVVVLQHVSFWIALGLILAFIPYFPHSKHLHLIVIPFNYLLQPERRSMGELAPLDFEDEENEQFGALNLEDLGWEQILDSYACIMCNRCQEVCPAYNTGKVLSPSALEVNKRYFLNYEGNSLAEGEQSKKSLLDFAIKEEAVWACTTCGACIGICPVGNEPMRDILDIRRGLVLMENKFPEQWQTAFRGMERTNNPWNIPSSERMKWAEGLNVPTVKENPDFEYLWWVGCAPSTDAQAQKTAIAFVKILNAAGINYAVLGEQETCSGDSARRAGNEYLFYEMATANVELLNGIGSKKIITTCPHCFHTIKNEYPAFGGNYQVIHHSQFIEQLLNNGRISLHHDAAGDLITYHDPCYLGRQNGIIKEPRLVIQQTGASLIEMPRHGTKSFCCGAGGAQIWKEEEEGTEAIEEARFDEAVKTGADTIAVACPFCMIMLTDAAKTKNSDMKIKDIAEIVAEML
ncbi:MAG TPA: (Fe-S)-binding protein [Anaerolineae bacterium]|nr:(Fe-S)-binding protein [Anaerolineae bacterium]